MTPDELNREIAEKLMGVPYAKEWHQRIEGGYINFFTEGWGQLKKAIVKIQIPRGHPDNQDGHLYIAEITSTFGYFIHIGEDDGDFVNADHTIIDDWTDDEEQARYEAVESVWPEILKGTPARARGR